MERVRRLAYETRDHLFDEATRDAAISDARIGGDWKPEQLRADAEPASAAG
jgi:hypothetical protein